MTYQQIIEFIASYKEIQSQIELLEEELNCLEITGISAINYNVIITSKTNNVVSITENEAIHYIDYKEILEKSIYILKQRIKIINKALAALTELEKNIVEQKVIENYPYYRICSTFHISERYARKIKSDAIKKLKRIINIEF